MLLALDPGMNSPGAAVFDEYHGVLVQAGRVRIPSGFADLPDGARWLAVAREIVEWSRGCKFTVDRVVFEKPQWYQRAKSKGDPNQLAGVAGVAANVTGLLGSVVAVEVFSPTPAEWIGQLSKVCPVCKGRKSTMSVKRKRVPVICGECHGSAWETPRGRRIRSRLTPAELALVPDQNDAIDAVGIGLWRLGRLAPRSALSNGRD